QATPQVENSAANQQTAVSQPAGTNLGASMRRMENVGASLVADKLKNAAARSTSAASTTASVTKPISTGSVFKEVLNIGLAKSSDKGTKLTANEAKEALDTFNFGDGTVKKSEVLAVQIEFGELKKSGKPTPEAIQVFNDWLAANANAPSGGQDSLRRADAFRYVADFVRYSDTSQGGQKVTSEEATALLNIIGPTPAPPRIEQVKEFRDSLKGTKQGTTTAIRTLDNWLKAHTMPTVPASLSAAVQPSIKNLLWPSETDRPIQPVVLGNAPSPRANL